ncbi:MAG: hypothetical protein O2970_11220 [Proteobacteria bacterium]|nr:hypothetical protein [Pseudomonadota bacterium]
MKMMRLLVVVSLLFTTACVSNTTVRSKTNYENTLKAKETIAVLPSTAEVYTVGFGKKERMYDYEAGLEELINRELIPLFKEKGYNVRNLRKADIHDKGISRKVVDLKESYHPKIRNLYTPVLMKKELALNTNVKVDDKASSELKDATEADVISVVNYTGTVQTNGARALGFAMDVLVGGSTAAETSTLTVSLLDADTGELLWSNLSSVAKDLFSSGLSNLSEQEEVDKKNINRLGKNLLRNLPDRQYLGLTEEEIKLLKKTNKS